MDTSSCYDFWKLLGLPDDPEPWSIDPEGDGLDAFKNTFGDGKLEVITIISTTGA